jgi:hypothetical protein
MAKAAAIAMAALITDQLGFQQVNFLSYNQQLVNFLNEQNHTNPPNRRMKYYTQIFCNSAATRTTVIAKIQRSQNPRADALAKQALTESLLPHSPELTCTYTSATHDQCTLQEALQFVTLNSVCLLTACG